MSKVTRQRGTIGKGRDAKLVTLLGPCPDRRGYVKVRDQYGFVTEVKRSQVKPLDSAEPEARFSFGSDD